MPLSEIVAHLFCGYIRYRLVQELGMVVVFVCIFTATIEINSHANIDARLPQATGKPSAAAEQIHGVDSVIPDLPSCRFSCHFYQTHSVQHQTTARPAGRSRSAGPQLSGSRSRSFDVAFHAHIIPNPSSLLTPQLPQVLRLLAFAVLAPFRRRLAD